MGPCSVLFVQHGTCNYTRSHSFLSGRTACFSRANVMMCYSVANYGRSNLGRRKCIIYGLDIINLRKCIIYGLEIIYLVSKSWFSAQIFNPKPSFVRRIPLLGAAKYHYIQRHAEGWLLANTNMPAQHHVQLPSAASVDNQYRSSITAIPHTTPSL